MPPLTPSAISMMPLRLLLDLLDLAFLDFLHGRARRLLARDLDLRRAALLELLRTLTRHDDEFELVHTGSFPALSENELTICATTGAMTRGLARSASTMALRRSTHASSASLTTT